MDPLADCATVGFTVLLSSAGRRVALLDAFRCALDALALSGRVIATDASALAPAAHTADTWFQVPPLASPDFVRAMVTLCREQRVDLLVPTIDPELSVYAAEHDEFEAAGTAVAISSADAVAVAADKQRTHAWLISHDLPTVRQATPSEVVAHPDEWPFPLMVKPRFGSASHGVRVVRCPADLAAATTGEEFVVQTIAPGLEYTVDVLIDAAGRCVCAIPRRRLEVRGGEVSKGVTVRHPPLQQLAATVGEALPGAYGPLTIQIFVDPDTGRMNIIEINPRFGGGFPLAWQAGGDYPRWLIEELLGRPTSASAERWRHGLVMLRWDDAVFLDAATVGLEL